jgi:predicted nuclease of predicted toxin-antitoxin system
VLRILIDENLDHRILRGLKRRLPDLDYVITQQDDEIAGAKDPPLLAWAAEHGRILITHDVNTVTDFAFERVAGALPMPGVIIVPEDLGIGIAIDELELVVACGEPRDFENKVEYLPL